MAESAWKNGNYGKIISVTCTKRQNLRMLAKHKFSLSAILNDTHSHSPDPGYHYLVKTLDMGRCVEFEVFIKDLRSCFLIRTIRDSFPRWRIILITIRPIQLFTNPLNCSQIDALTLWNIRHGDPESAVEYAFSKFLTGWIVWCCSFSHRWCPTANVIRCSRLKKKQSACAKLNI